MVTTEAITLAEVFTTSSTECSNILGTKEPSAINAQNSSLEVSGSWSVNLDSHPIYKIVSEQQYLLVHNLHF